MWEMQLVGVGVRCVKVTLPGWDRHVNNHQAHRKPAVQLDPALSALVQGLKRRNLLRDAVV